MPSLAKEYLALPLASCGFLREIHAPQLAPSIINAGSTINRERAFFPFIFTFDPPPFDKGPPANRGFMTPKHLASHKLS
jgi:hypothetical protein